MPLLLALLGCAAPEPVDSVDPTCEASEASTAFIVRELKFARETKDGVSWGFDLDGGDEGDGCDVREFVSPSGEEDVDNGFAMLLPALELTEAEAIEPIIQETINTGSLMIMFELVGLDDPRDDSCVDLHLVRGGGDVALSPDGWILPNQTFDRDLGKPAAHAYDQQMVRGALRAEGVTFELPMTFLDAELNFVMHDATTEIRIDEDGEAWGILAGGLDTASLIELAAEQGIAQEVLDTVETFLGLVTDLDSDGDGECDRIAVTFVFRAVPAFFYADSAQYEE
ncbi:MAG: hypothetical protein H6740_19995 [Alphaproteobacteria bacterium]|nr:hypothetical protein [Alphaproteobacteria bacterium]